MSRHTIPASDSTHLSVSIPKKWVDRAMAAADTENKSSAFRTVMLAGMVTLEKTKEEKWNWIETR